jgi:hypothetical protein
MEPRGCNRWQPVANAQLRQRPEQAKTVAVGLRPVAAMVRRGSPVRVRKRASQERRTRRFSIQDDLLFLECAVGMDSFMVPSGHRRASLDRVRIRCRGEMRP